MQRIKHTHLLILGLVLMSGCTWLTQRMTITQCNFTWEDLQHKGSSLMESRFQISLRAQNPNPNDAVLDRIVYTFYADDLELIQGTTQGTVSVPAGQSAPIEIELTVKHLKALKAIQKIKSGKVKQYRLTARVFMSSPFGELSYDIDLWRESAGH